MLVFNSRPLILYVGLEFWTFFQSQSWGRLTCRSPYTREYMVHGLLRVRVYQSVYCCCWFMF